MFTEFLSASDAQRVSLLLEKLSAYGFGGGALAGSLATEAHLLSQGRNTERRRMARIRKSGFLASRVWKEIGTCGLTSAVFTVLRVPKHRRKDPQS